MKKFTQKLAAYSAVAGAMLTVGQTANAQVVYTDVDPDESFTAGSYNLDLNNDATTDFVLDQASNYGGWETVRILPQGGAGFLSTQYPPASGWGTYIFAQMLSDGQTIDNAGAFNASSTNTVMSLAFAGSITAGPWLGQTEQFLGLRFTLDGGTTYYYGWARVSVNAAANEFTIHDYAYESTADVAIDAGNQGVAGPTCDGISVANITETTADILATPSADGDLYYVLLLDADAAPTADEVIAGTGSGGAAAIVAGDMTVIADTEATVNLTGLTGSTAYTAYLVLDDGLKTLSVVYDADFTTSTVGLEKLNADNFNVFPNPSTGVFNINTQNGQNLNIIVSDITGRVVLEKTINSTDNMIDLRSSNKGVYNIQINNGNSIITKKVVIE